MVKQVKTTCPYCGVGCGILASIDTHGQVSVVGDPDHPANFGRLCSKGSALGETVDRDGRLLYPSVRGQQVSMDEALNEVADGFARIMHEHGPGAVAFYVSGQLLTEDYYVANKLMKGFIGSANIDTNSRLCMSSTVAAYTRAFGSDTVPCCYEDLERARMIVLTGSNTAWCHPVLFQRINKAKQENPDLVIVVIDPRKTAACDIADLHLPLRPGSDAMLFNGLLNYLQQQGEHNALFTSQVTQGMEDALAAASHAAPSLEAVANYCGLSEQDLSEFYRMYARTERVVTVFSQGVNQSSSGTDKVNSIINCHLYTGRIGRPGMGPFSFTGQPNAMGGREVGGLANQLAAHMALDNPQHCHLVQEFWQSPLIADTSGYKAVDLFSAMNDGKIKAVWIMATNPVVSLPEAKQVRQALSQCELVVVSDVMAQTDTTAMAHVLLPAQAWAEKSGTVTNSERRISRQRLLMEAPAETKPDWWLITEVARRMGHGDQFAYESELDIFREHAALSGYKNEGTRDFDISALSGLELDDYNNLHPVQWPVTDNTPQGTARMFSDGRFYTENHKARFVAITPKQPVNTPTEEFPLILNTGRVRDQWHTMTRTGKSPRLAEHSPEPYLEIRPSDAIRHQLIDGGLARVTSCRGEVIVRVRYSKAQQIGNVFVPMHWNDQFSSNGCINTLVNAALDPISGQPEFKHTPVNISSYQPAWHGFLLSRRSLDLQGLTYWARATGNGFFRYEIAGEQVPDAWPEWTRCFLCASDDDVNWVEYLDVGTRRYRGARLVGGRVESCIFIAPDHALPSRAWLASLFEKQALQGDERQSLLTGQPPPGQEDIGRVVCACFGVGEKTINHVIQAQGLKTAEEVGKCLNAGTNCGSCVPEIKAIIDAVR
jgi:assimilatory nitrate reductase catalytic subunit